MNKFESNIKINKTIENLFIYRKQETVKKKI